MLRSDSMHVMDEIIAHGFPRERGRLIHALVGGSQLHGVKVEGTDDRDLYGIYIETPECCFWQGLEHYVTSTAPQSERNQAGDVDVICYSLRRFARLAAAGNPTILHMLFTPAESNEIFWSEVIAARDLFLAKAHAQKYQGYADAQLRRMTGDRGRGKHGQRPELEKQYGYDVKAAMHVLRLLHEGIEFVSKGWVTLPRPEPERSKLLAVRRGEWSQDRVIAEAHRLFAELDAAVEHSPLPERVDLDAIGRLVTEICLDAWEQWGWSGKRSTDSPLGDV
ncbi:MAG TPA: nucleotidyltransferase domain-containing protein [Terriglobia bacterium]|nr:nucleotidyltransferase domain-containing protein [Terriglobia bacterium]